MLFVVLGSGVLHAVWNAITKAIDDRLVAFAWIGVALSLCGWVGVALIGLPGRLAAEFALSSAAVHVVYDLCLMNAYRLGSFNQMYPIARGTSPLVVALGATVLTGEHPGALALTGIVVLALGLVWLALSSGQLERGELPAIGAAVLTGLVIAGYSLIDGIGVRHAHDALSYVALLFALEGPVFVAVAAVRRSPRQWVQHGVAGRALLAGFLSVAAYGAVIWSQTRAPLAEVAALRETGVISAAVIGAVFFKERFGYRRVMAAVVVALGVALISL